jgi:hypothetical protein
MRAAASWSRGWQERCSTRYPRMRAAHGRCTPRPRQGAVERSVKDAVPDVLGVGAVEVLTIGSERDTGRVVTLRSGSLVKARNRVLRKHPSATTR